MTQRETALSVNAAMLAFAPDTLCCLCASVLIENFSINENDHFTMSVTHTSWHRLAQKGKGKETRGRDGRTTLLKILSSKSAFNQCIILIRTLIYMQECLSRKNQ